MCFEEVHGYIHTHTHTHTHTHIQYLSVRNVLSACVISDEMQNGKEYRFTYNMRMMSSHFVLKREGNQCFAFWQNVLML